MDASSILTGLLFGFAGQGIRILVALYKTASNPHESVSEWTLRRVIVTLVIGAIAGALAVLVFPWGKTQESGEVVAYIAAGYSGTDFIEGMMSAFLPKSTEQRRS